MEKDKPDASGEVKTPAIERERADPTDSIGVHPVGTAVGGAAGAAAAGAAVGSVAGPIGAAVGGAIGVAAGAIAGRLVADVVDPEMEDQFWRENWSDRKYVEEGFTYDQDWGPAYRYGVDAYVRHPDKNYDDLEEKLSSRWASARGESRLEWNRARHAARDAWQRISDTVGRSDGT
jgi:hypothetical protein